MSLFSEAKRGYWFYPSVMTAVYSTLLTRCKTLYPDNYLAYRRACIDGGFKVGQCLSPNASLSSQVWEPIAQITSWFISQTWLPPTIPIILFANAISWDVAIIATWAYPINPLRRFASHRSTRSSLIYAEYGQDTITLRHRCECRFWLANGNFTDANWGMAGFTKVRIDIHVPKGIELT